MDRDWTGSPLEAHRANYKTGFEKHAYEFGQPISYPEIENKQEIEVSKAMTWLDGDLLTARPSPNLEALNRLEIEGDFSFEQIESTILAFAASADI